MLRFFVAGGDIAQVQADTMLAGTGALHLGTAAEGMALALGDFLAIEDAVDLFDQVQVHH
ncbi:hypothetical protein D3C80_1929270 [compost metagenome]